MIGTIGPSISGEAVQTVINARSAKSKAAVLAVVAWTLLGCEQSPPLTGTFKGIADVGEINTTDETLARAIRRVELKLDDKGDFTLMLLGLPWSGETFAQGSGLVLKPKFVAERSVETQPEQLKVLASKIRITIKDRDRLQLEAPGLKQPVNLNRLSQP